jgi:radical SAM superfamily enzyme YgiQ (UPF0313 family)
MADFPSGNRGSEADIVLVSCYELGHEPLGATVPAGALERAGIAARIMDVAVEEFDAGVVAAARLVAISTPMHTALRLGTRVAARVREINPSAHVCFYGLYAGLHASHLSPGLADTCLDAECESDLVELARAIIARRDRPARDVGLPPGRRWPLRPRDRSLDLTPHRAAIRSRERYVRLAHAGALHEVGCVVTTRGCKHLCRHCPIPAAYGGRFYALPLAGVLADIDTVVQRGARHISFADADFLNGPTHALRVARELHRRHVDVTFDYTAKIEHLLRHPDVIDELQNLGNLFVVSAVESFNDTVLARLRKGHTRDDALAVIRRFRARGLTLRPSLVPFTPWETRASLAELFAVVAAEDLVDGIDPVQYSIRLLLPEGSLLLEDESVRPLLGGFDAERLSYAWAHPDPAMDELQGVLTGLALAAPAAGDDAAATFARMRGAVTPGRSIRPVAARRDPRPRLTEDWFC